MKGFSKRIKNGLIKVLINLSKRTGLVKEKRFGSPPSRFLIVTTTGIGDTLWGTPAIRALKETYPSSYLCVLTTSTGVELLKGNPSINRFFIFRRGLRLFPLIKLLKEMRRERFHMSFIFHASDRIIWPLVFFTGSQIIGIRDQNKGLDFVLSRTIKNDYVHAVEMRLRLVNEVGARASSTNLDLYLNEDDRAEAHRILKEHGLENVQLLIGLHPGAQKPYKCWPAERFIEIGKKLVKEHGCRIIITGGNNEEDLCQYVASNIDGAISVAGKVTLRETAALIERMQLFITNDTGPMHIAFALGTPTIALFCPTDPKLCGPFHANNVTVIKKGITCEPCKGKACLNPLCMNQITIDEVLEAVNLLLTKEVLKFEYHVKK